MLSILTFELENMKDRLSRPGTIQMYHDHCDNFNNGNSTQIDLDLAEEQNHRPITDMSILGGISKIWGIAKNVSLFGTSQKVSIS